MPHVFIFAFTLLLVTAMELTWPVKGKSFVNREGVECATVALAKEDFVEPSVESFANFTEEIEDAKGN